jgi:hypothetical protein
MLSLQVQLRSKYWHLATMYDETDPAALLQFFKVDDRHRRQKASN